MFRLNPLVVLPLAKLVLHLGTYRGYGIFRDEFYYIACSKRLDFGYVDQPPLSLLFLAVQRFLFGESLFAIRLLPAVVGALTVLVAGLLARELGGGRFAQTLVMVAIGIEFLGVFHVYSMNCFDVLIWATAAYLLVLLVKGTDPRLWLVLGALLGLGLQNKISVLWLGAGLAVGLLATGERRWLGTRWPWAAGGLALLILLPHLFWQVAHGWPTVEFIRNATGQKMIEVAPLQFIWGQLELLSPSVVPLWLGGLVWLFVGRDGRRFRILAWIYLAVFAILLLSGSSRTGYLGPTYVWLLAAGAAAWEAWIARREMPWLKEATLAIVLIGGLVFLPFSLPVLPVETYIAYADALGVGPTTEERKELAELPQHYADMHGWEELADTVVRVFATLSPEERDQAAIFTYNYGNAGAIDYFGPSLGLPPAISGHNNYWLWGPRRHTGEIVVVLGGDSAGLRNSFGSVERAGTIDCRYCMPYEDNRPIWIARRLHLPIAELWPRLKHYD